MSRTLIRGGRVVTAVDDYIGDILIEDGRIEAIGRRLEAGDAAVHDAAGLLVLPGGIDAHVHMETPMGDLRTVDSFESGTVSAAFGGTTTIIDFAQQFMGESPRLALERRLAAAEPQCCIDYAFHVILTDANRDALAELPSIIADEGVSSFKLYMAYPGVLMVDDADIYRTMCAVGEHGGMVNLHAENGAVIQALIDEALEGGRTSPKHHALTRPSIMEGEATHRVIRIAELVDIPVYIVHLSAKEALDAVVEARDRGLHVFAETCPHYLFLDETMYDAPGFEAAKFVMTPPLRNHDCQQALWRGLQFDDLQLVATDHCPFCFNEERFGILMSKAAGKEDFSRIPNGAPGVEYRLPLLFDGGVGTGKINLNRFVQLVSTAPAKMFGLFPRKGTIAVGSDADIVLFDPEAEHVLSAETHHSLVDYSMFEGRRVKGQVSKVFLRGELIVDGTQWHGRAGMGQYQKRGASGRIL
ncbi:MAG: dihydropyrimidinase [Pseudomonadota bacterium]